MAKGVDGWRKVGVVVSLCGLVIVVAGLALGGSALYADKTVAVHAATVGHEGMAKKVTKVEADVVGLKVDVASIRATVDGNRDALGRIEEKLDRIKPAG